MAINSAGTDNYYRSHDASADYLYKVLMGGEEEAKLSPVTDIVTAVEEDSEKVKTTLDSADLGGSNSGGFSEQTNGEPTSSMDGLGLGGLVGTAVGTAASIGAQAAGLPAGPASFAGGVAKGIADKGLSTQDLGNLGIKAGMVALGVPGLAMSALGLLGFNPMQGLSELLGISEVTPGYEGGFFGSPGIGRGVEGTIAATDKGLPAGFESTDLGLGLSTNVQQGIMSEMGGVKFSGMPPDVISDIAEAMADAFAGGYEGLATETSYGDLAGLGGSNEGGSDPGPSGTGNSGNPGEG